MKQLATLTLLALLTSCAGCESTPVPVKLPPLPTPEVQPEVKPAEPIAKFAVGDKVSLDTGKRVLNGVILAVGPLGVWENDTTGETRTSHAYQVRFTVPGKVWVGILPEFALKAR